MKHTPGPWHVGLRQAEKIVYDETGWAIANATVYHGESDAEQVKANARLIATAPDLLASLRRLVRMLGTNDSRLANFGEVEEARAVIAKATGE